MKGVNSAYEPPLENAAKNTRVYNEVIKNHSIDFETRPNIYSGGSTA